MSAALKKHLIDIAVWAFKGIAGGVVAAIFAFVIFIYNEVMEVKDVVIRLEQEMVSNRRDIDRIDRHMDDKTRVGK